MYDIKVYEYEFNSGDVLNVILHKTEVLGLKFTIAYNFKPSFNVILGATTRYVMSIYDSSYCTTYLNKDVFWSEIGKRVFSGLLEDIYDSGKFKLLPMLTNSIDDFFLVIPVVGNLKSYGNYTEVV